MIQRSSTKRLGHKSWRNAAAAALVCAALAFPVAAGAHDHDPERSGHPLRILAYAFHPVGYVLDAVLFRPFHWLGHQKGVREVFGHDDR